ncbi:MAG: aldo/keto reductase [Myxococcales bacterium]|nr:aldo/keto reductase [Myxococcales bacterium]
MLTRALGETGLRGSVVGLGAGPLGDERLDDAAAERLVRGALDLGVTLFDTAPSYGRSEERLGRALAGQSGGDVLVSTKLGYGVDGVEDWTGECVRRGVDRALGVLRRERIDIAHLHSCGPEILAREEIRRALEDAVRDGKVGVAAYSGDGDGLRAAKSLGLFRCFQVSHNLVDQEACAEGMPDGAAVLGKRTLLNAAFVLQGAERPDVAEYERRFAAVEWPELVRDRPAAAALRFAAFGGPHAVLVGTSRLDNLARAVEALDEGPLPLETRRAIEEAWGRARWPGLI